MKMIRETVHGGGHNRQINAYYAVTRIHRKQYGTIEQFVNAYRQKVEYANSVKMDFKPYGSILSVMDGVREELKAWYEVKLSTFSEDAPEKMTWNDFLQICKEIKDKAMTIEPNQAMAAPKGKTNQQNNSQGQS